MQQDGAFSTQQFADFSQRLVSNWYFPQSKNSISYIDAWSVALFDKNPSFYCYVMLTWQYTFHVRKFLTRIISFRLPVSGVDGGIVAVSVFGAFEIACVCSGPHLVQLHLQPLLRLFHRIEFLKTINNFIGLQIVSRCWNHNNAIFTKALFARKSGIDALNLWTKQRQHRILLY